VAGRRTSSLTFVGPCLPLGGRDPALRVCACMGVCACPALCSGDTLCAFGDPKTVQLAGIEFPPTVFTAALEVACCCCPPPFRANALLQSGVPLGLCAQRCTVGFLEVALQTQLRVAGAPTCCCRVTVCFVGR
jgi:hypothetical protein